MAKVDVTMPKMGESITEGTVIEWHKQAGDEIEQDETLLEIGTDKVDTEVPSPQAGALAEVLVEAGDTVEVGAKIAVIETEPEAADAGEDADAPAAQANTEEEQAAEEGGDDVEEASAASAQPEEEATASEEGEQQDTPDEETPAPETREVEGEDTEIVMPKMGESITEGTVITWHKEPGDEIEQDEILLEIGTDKVDTEVPSPKAGTLKEILVEEGETVEVGAAIAVVGSGAAAGGGEDAAPPSTAAGEETGEEETTETQSAASQDGAGEGAAEPASQQQPSGDGAMREPATAEAGGEPIERHDESGQFYSPLVRSIAQEEGLSMKELQSISGSGREGRVTKEDVMDYLEEGRPEQQASETQEQQQGSGEVQTQRAAPAEEEATPVQQERSAPPPAQAGDYEGRVEIIEMDRMRQLTAEHMVRSKATSAHVTSFAEADVTGLVERRERHQEAFQEREGIKLTFTPFFVDAAIEALKEHPVLNASVEEDQIIVKKDYHIGMAVAIGKKGLMAPVIRHADQQNLNGLAHTAADLAERARSKQLQPDELQSGTFTVTNIGSLGSIMGTPIINQPQVGILATGAIKKRPVVIEDDNLGDIIAVRHMMYLSLSYDHRVIDGAMGASFLQKVVTELEAHDPEEEI